MVVHRKDAKKQKLKVKIVHFFDEKPFLRKIIPKVVSMGLNTKDMKK